ncbi:hypothetical protein EHI8A_047450 [Entamoeba histolytica HM-1:IMSS-B]|uniref:CudA family protein n=4 Tax=Entamoeba histolytica TaxID=5759 RepID=C4LVI2_ENTH1|nr:hypothetical protein EHI_103380 [Entamoeba histolytica HM-1:IMSS]EAL47040.1 hypothetical protein EHI_103380 [Entamoeba histolytica HM-1:IMSS]EMH74392.1 hypothetical protein EHI8A_047450 [Entamoeba histolytica HM-1:IMSS-B]ENY64421.1 cudA family protein, putative [Entamoeba histolytica HM-1:IMSS-A]GAT92679.1 hypothetical protein CL6EHI_103380 [Entamoeba histolytica]|eukprot:XP_652426.1 hypothetical protein EHI_103380 [Entamoeba histolytica HM-1:IMSS]
MNQSIFIERQTCARTQVIGNKEIYIVVKQNNFYIQLRSETMQLTECEFKCVLIYDTPDKRLVPFVNASPIKYKIHQLTTHSVSIESKLTVLSSQHEDMLFIVRIDILNHKELITKLFSAPIKVTSKPESKKKLKFDSFKRDNEKKPKICENLNISNSSSLTDESNICVFTLLATNSILMEQIRKNLNKIKPIETLENGLKKYIRLMLSLDFSCHQYYLFDSLKSLSPQQITALEEISNVFSHSSHSIPFINFNQQIQSQETQYDLISNSVPNPFLRKSSLEQQF